MLTNRQKNQLLIAVLIVGAGAVAATMYFSNGSEESSPALRSTQTLPSQPQPGQATGGTPQPPGEAPPGQVWSSEHGHWHNISDATPGTTQPQGQLTPQPPGEPPPGKTWSPEHGHWHDAPSVKIIDEDVNTQQESQSPRMAGTYSNPPAGAEFV